MLKQMTCYTRLRRWSDIWSKLNGFVYISYCFFITTGLKNIKVSCRFSQFSILQSMKQWSYINSAAQIIGQYPHFVTFVLPYFLSRALNEETGRAEQKKIQQISHVQSPQLTLPSMEIC